MTLDDVFSFHITYHSIPHDFMEQCKCIKSVMESEINDKGLQFEDNCLGLNDTQSIQTLGYQIYFTYAFLKYNNSRKYISVGKDI